MIAISKRRSQYVCIYVVLLLASLLMALCLWAVHEQKKVEEGSSAVEKPAPVLAPVEGASSSVPKQQEEVYKGTTKMNPDGSVTVKLDLKELSFNGMGTK